MKCAIRNLYIREATGRTGSGGLSSGKTSVNTSNVVTDTCVRLVITT